MPNIRKNVYKFSNFLLWTHSDPFYSFLTRIRSYWLHKICTRVMKITNNSIPTLLPFCLPTLSHLTQITMGCFLNTAESLNQSLIGFSTASSPSTSYAPSPARFGEHNNKSHVTANYMKFRTYLELLPTTKWKGMSDVSLNSSLPTEFEITVT